MHMHGLNPRHFYIVSFLKFICNNVGWVDLTDVCTMPDERLTFTRMGKGDHGEITQVCNLTIHDDLSWHIFTDDQRIPSNASIFIKSSVNLPQSVRSLRELEHVLQFLSKCEVCSGNCDEKFQVLVESRKGNFMNATSI